VIPSKAACHPARRFSFLENPELLKPGRTRAELPVFDAIIFSRWTPFATTGF
jgi:hypothetical protein